MKKQQDASTQYRLGKEELARLASIPSLAALKKSEKRALVGKERHSGKTLRLSLGGTLYRPRSIDGGAEKNWIPGEEVPYTWIVLWEVHPWAREFINNLLNGKPADLRKVSHLVYEVLYLPLAEPEKSDRRSDRVLPFTRKGHTAGGPLIDTLVASLKEIPFPYRRCPWCKTTVVCHTGQRGRARVYCSKTCKSRANEEDRRGTRGAYMRKYMRKKRERAEARAKAEERAKQRTLPPVVKIRGTLTGKREQW